jgi:adenylyl cyclase-associated protein
MAEFIALSNEVGEETAKAGGKVKELFDVVGELNNMASVCKKPSSGDLPGVLSPLNSAIKGVTGIRKPKDRKSPQNLFLDAVNGGVGAVGFVAAETKSWEVVAQNIDMFQFVGDKIMMQYRKTGPESYTKWVNAYKALLNALKAFAKDHHPTGLKWQLTGKDTSDYVPGEVATGGGGGGGAPAAAPAAAAAPAGGGGGGAAGAWSAVESGPLATFMGLSNEVGDEVKEMAGHFQAAFGAVADLIAMASVCKKPSADALGGVFADLTTHMRAATGVRGPKRSSPLDLHWKCLKSAVNCLSFVAVDNKSWNTVQAALEEFEFNGNKLLQQFRKTGPELYVTWHGSVKDLLNAVKTFAKDQAPCGLKWDMMGKDISEYSKDPRAKPAAAAAPAGGKGGKAGPPKGGPKIKTIDNSKMAAAKTEGGQPTAADALFAELNALKGNAAAGLKKATKGKAVDRKVVDSRAKKTSAAAAAKKSRFPMKEGYEGMDLYKLAYCYGTRASKERKVINLENPRKDAVLIMECEDVAIEIKGVAKNISIAGCKRFQITLDGSIGQVEVSNIQSGYITIGGKVYQVTCDKCDGLEVTLTPEAYSAKIISSCCSSLNVGLDNPDKSAEMEFLTLPVPSQYETLLQIDGDKAMLVTEPVSHNFG